MMRKLSNLLFILFKLNDYNENAQTNTFWLNKTGSLAVNDQEL